MDGLPEKLHFSPGNILSFFLLERLRPREAPQTEPEGMSDEYKCCTTHEYGT